LSAVSKGGRSVQEVLAEINMTAAGASRPLTGN
jgi:hypothetical protein